ncbi:MAG TPA: hypothetical protein VEI03_14835 [Stellaceae bacterium]|nr:hypothetical protein [Stellaceae bacterium]
MTEKSDREVGHSYQAPSMVVIGPVTKLTAGPVTKRAETNGFHSAGVTKKPHVNDGPITPRS